MKPRWLEEAEKDIGLREIKGMKHSTRILAMFRAIGHGWVTNDETPWCAAAVGAWLQRAGLPHTGKLNARSYEKYGREIPAPCLGAIAVMWRGSPNSPYGHVAPIAGQTSDGNLVCLGANQNDMVCYAKFIRKGRKGSRIITYRYPIGEPISTTPLPIFTDVQLSTSEA